MTMLPTKTGGIDLARILSAIGPGLMAAGQQGWGAFSPAVQQGALGYDQGQDRKRQIEMDKLTEEMRRQQLADARTANQDALRERQAMDSFFSPGPLGTQQPNNGRPGGMAPQAGPLGGGLLSPDIVAQFRGAPDSVKRAVVEASIQQKFAAPKGRETVEIAGRLVDAATGEVIKDLSAEEIALRQASRPITSVTTTMPPVEKEFDKALGKLAGEQAASITPSADKARASLDQFNALEKTLADMQAVGGDTGRLAPMVGDLTAYAQSVGIDPSSIGLPANAGPYEQALAITNKLALANIGAESGGLPANNFTEADRKYITQIAPQISNVPEGIAAKIDMGKRVAKRNLDAEALWNSGRYEQTQAGFRQYQKDWSAYVRANPLYTEQEKSTLRSLSVSSGSGGAQTVIDGYTITPVQ